MLTQIRQIIQQSQIAAALRQMPARQRLIVAVGGVFVLTTLGVVAYMTSAPSYVPVFSQLDPADAGKSVKRLEEAKIAYRLTGGGTEIQVSDADAARARVLLAEAGLPESGRPGFELFDKPSWGMTDFSQRVNYRRALEGELERTLTRIDGVKSATVHITLSEKSPFRKNERDASASVILSLRPNVTLDRKTVRGITYMVSSSVERLPSERVTVLDGSGQVLSAPEDGSVGGVVDRQIEIRNRLEAELKEKVRSLVSNLVGAENVRVEVSAQMNFDQVQRTAETYDPERQVVLSEQRSESTAPAEDVIMTAPEQNNSTTNYENSRSVENVVSAPGNVSRLSIAVLVNHKVRVEGDTVAHEARSEAEIQRLQELVRSAVGYNEARGDQVVVTSAPFEPVPAPVEEPMTAAEYVAAYSGPAFGIVALLVALFLGIRLLRLLQPRGYAASVQQPDRPEKTEAEEIEMVPFVLEPTVEEMDTKRMIESARQLTASHPEVATRFMKSWIQES